MRSVALKFPHDEHGQQHTCRWLDSGTCGIDIGLPRSPTKPCESADERQRPDHCVFEEARYSHFSRAKHQKKMLENSNMSRAGCKCVNKESRLLGPSGNYGSGCSRRGV